jgi:hypothetical protein
MSLVRRMMVSLFGHTRDQGEKHIRQLWMALVLALLACAMLGGLLYWMSKPSYF